MSARKFSDEAAKLAILNKNNVTVKQILREMGVSALSGSNYKLIYRVVEKEGLDTSHWLGQKIAKTLSGVKNSQWKDCSLYLKDNGLPITSYALKNKLLTAGIKQRLCERCLRTEWNAEPIPLDLHHKNGEKTDNRIENIQLLCPNCHAQTPNYCSKNRKNLRMAS